MTAKLTDDGMTASTRRESKGRDSARTQPARRSAIRSAMRAALEKTKSDGHLNTHGAPFYGSRVSRLPPLGQDFIDHVSRLITAQRPDLAPVDGATLLQSFESFGHRP